MLIYVLIWVAMLPAGLGVLVLMPVLAGTLYASFQDVFGERPACRPRSPKPRRSKPVQARTSWPGAAGPGSSTASRSGNATRPSSPSW